MKRLIRAGSNNIYSKLEQALQGHLNQMLGDQNFKFDINLEFEDEEMCIDIDVMDSNNAILYTGGFMLERDRLSKANLNASAYGVVESLKEILYDEELIK